MFVTVDVMDCVIDENRLGPTLLRSLVSRRNMLKMLFCFFELEMNAGVVGTCSSGTGSLSSSSSDALSKGLADLGSGSAGFSSSTFSSSTGFSSSSAFFIRISSLSNTMN